MHFMAVKRSRNRSGFAIYPSAKSNVCAIIPKSAKKSCKLVPLPTSLLVNCLTSCCPWSLLWLIYYQEKVIFPVNARMHFLNFYLRMLDWVSTIRTLRQWVISNFFSKVTERAVFDQLHKHLEDSDLYPVLQYAYIKQHSTETALLRVVNDILYNMNRQHVTLLVRLNLSSAFDTVDHDIMIRRLDVRILAYHKVLV